MPVHSFHTRRSSDLVSGKRGSADSVVAEQVRIHERKQGDKVTRTLGRLSARWVPDFAERAPLLTLDVVPAGKAGDFKVFYQGKPLSKAKLEVIAASGWKREYHTDEQGAFSAPLPWRGADVIEIQHVDPAAGREGGASHDGIRSVTTLSFSTSSGIEPLPTSPVRTPKREMNR
jgi:hypothetical protein